MRDSPSLDIIPMLIKNNCHIRVFDPEGMNEAKNYLFKYKDNITYCENAYNACENSQALVILTEWNQFRALDLEKLKEVLVEPIIIDLRNIYNPKEIQDKGFKYYSIGRQNSD